MNCVTCKKNISNADRYKIMVQRRVNGRWLDTAYGYCEECGERASDHRFKLHESKSKEDFYKLVGVNNG